MGQAVKYLSSRGRKTKRHITLEYVICFGLIMDTGADQSTHFEW